MQNDAQIRSNKAGTMTIVATRDGVLLGNVESTGGLVRVTAGGAITDNLSTEAANIAAASAALRAGTGIGDGIAGDMGDIDTAIAGDDCMWRQANRENLPFSEATLVIVQEHYDVIIDAIGHSQVTFPITVKIFDDDRK